MGWLARYHDGERDQVWHELRQWGDRVREPAAAAEAQAVCDEMARRARHNVELIVERLTAEGYRFHDNDDEETPVVPLYAPGAKVPEVLAWLDDRFDAVPMVVSSWLRIVGDVWLVGTHPTWTGSSGADPLVIELEGSRFPDSSIVDYFDHQYDQGESGFVLPASPDRLHKANISGGPPYGFRLPDGTAEGLFVDEVAMPFVSYLNWVFGNGGFPGPAEGTEQWKLKRVLTEDLLPL